MNENRDRNPVASANRRRTFLKRTGAATLMSLVPAAISPG